MRAYIIERLVGETGEPDHVTEAARKLAESARFRQSRRDSAETLSLPVDHRAEDRRADALRRCTAEGQGPRDDGGRVGIFARRADPDRSIANAVAVIVSAFFGGDPGCQGHADHAAAVADRDRGGDDVLRSRSPRRSTARASAPSSSRLPLAPAISGAELDKHVIRDGPGVRAVFSISMPSGSGHIRADHAATRPAEASRRQRRTPAHPASGASASATRSCARRSSWRRRCRSPAMTLGEVAGAA